MSMFVECSLLLMEHVCDIDHPHGRKIQKSGGLGCTWLVACPPTRTTMNRTLREKTVLFNIFTESDILQDYA